MSDLHVWELGPHDCTKPHEWPFGQETWCPGGREIVLRGEWFPVTGENATQYAYVVVEEAS